MFKKKKPLLTLEDKIDEILRYQKSEHRWTILKTLTNVTFFILFIVLPIVGIVYFFDWARDSLGIDLSQAKQVVEGLKTVGETKGDFTNSVDTLLESLNQQGSEGVEKLGLDDMKLEENLDNLKVNQQNWEDFVESQNLQ